MRAAVRRRSGCSGIAVAGDGSIYCHGHRLHFTYPMHHINRVLPGMQAAFVDLGPKVERAGLVPNPEAGKIENWNVWPYLMIPLALVGFLLTLRIWNAKPTKGGGGH